MATNCATLWNQKLWCGTLFLHKNKIKRRILQAGSLRHSIKKRYFMLWAKWTYFDWAGESPPPPSPPLSPQSPSPCHPISPLRLCACLCAEIFKNPDNVNPSFVKKIFRLSNQVRFLTKILRCFDLKIRKSLSYHIKSITLIKNCTYKTCRIWISIVSSSRLLSSNLIVQVSILISTFKL